MRFIKLLLTLTAMTAPSAAARAADGRIPISSVPYTISAPGVYYLTQDFTVASVTAITISASQVTLDLNGHTLTNSTSAGNIIASAANPGYTGIRITNGNLVGGASGMFLFNNAGGEYQVDHLFVSGTGQYGIFLGSASGSSPATHVVVDFVRVEACLGGGFGGIVLQNVFGGRITASSARTCPAGIVLYQSHGVLMDGNTLVSNSGAGITLIPNGLNVCRNNIISNNVIQQNSGTGISLNSANNNRISHNNISENGGGGILLATSNFNEVSGNTIAANTGDGIRLNSTSRLNSFDWNVVSGNTLFGLNFSDAGSTGNIYSFNRFAGDTSGAVGGTANNSAGFNNAGGANF